MGLKRHNKLTKIQRTGLAPSVLARKLLHTEGTWYKEYDIKLLAQTVKNLWSSPWCCMWLVVNG
jgi:hypothetical protein